MYTLIAPAKSEFPQLLSVWESSVSATHDFLRNGDMEFFKKIIIEKDVFSHVFITAAIDENKNIIGFAGVLGDNLEMLFVKEAFIGKGVGKLLMLHSINNLHVTKVDVNEQNTRAAAFYRHFGFKTVSRSEVDGTGMPYPILHMQL
jgi:putative acetyltransferase